MSQASSIETTAQPSVPDSIHERLGSLGSQRRRVEQGFAELEEAFARLEAADRAVEANWEAFHAARVELDARELRLHEQREVLVSRELTMEMEAFELGRRRDELEAKWRRLVRERDELDTAHFALCMQGEVIEAEPVAANEPTPARLEPVAGEVTYPDSIDESSAVVALALKELGIGQPSWIVRAWRRVVELFTGGIHVRLPVGAQTGSAEL